MSFGNEPTLLPVDVLHPAGDLLGEGPLWDHRHGRLVWVDILRGRVQSWSPRDGVRELVHIDALIGAVALAGDSDLLLATSEGLLLWRAATSEVELLLNPITSEVRFNDGRVDAAGRFWVGTMARDAARYAEPLGVLYRVDPDGSAHQMETGLTISNGIDWSPDGGTLYLTDTMRRLIYAYDFDARAGTIKNRRTFVATDAAHGYPDGLVVDCEGHVWSACFGGHCLCRYDPLGRLVQRIQMPVSCPTAITFSGLGANTAFVTTSCHTLRKDHSEPHAGSLLRLKLPSSGRATAIFGSGVTH